MQIADCRGLNYTKPTLSKDNFIVEEPGLYCIHIIMIHFPSIRKIREELKNHIDY